MRVGYLFGSTRRAEASSRPGIPAGRATARRRDGRAEEIELSVSDRPEREDADQVDRFTGRTARSNRPLQALVAVFRPFPYPSET